MGQCVVGCNVWWALLLTSALVKRVVSTWQSHSRGLGAASPKFRLQHHTSIKRGKGETRVNMRGSWHHG